MTLKRPPGKTPAGEPPLQQPGAPDSQMGSQAASQPPSSGPPPRKRGRKRLVLLAVALLIVAAGGYEGYRWWTVGRFEESTDDAYVGANMTILEAKVSGYVTAVDVHNNQPVKVGDVIARIDDGDYRLAVKSAQDRIATQKATIARIAVQATAAQADVDQAQAQIASARAGLERASLAFDRQSKLAKKDFASRQALDNARAERDQAAAALKSAKAGLSAAESNVAVLNAQGVEAEHSLQGLETALAQAERNLSFTVVRAPVNGVIGNKSVEVGQLVQAGTRLAAVVPLDDVYVDANFKETQLENMRPGQTVEVTVDSYPGQVFKGRIESISPASGALFSLLPPQNATGNFTKIVQRLPVRIRFSRETTSKHVLRAGMSVVVTVDTRAAPTASAAAGDETGKATALAARP